MNTFLLVSLKIDKKSIVVGSILRLGKHTSPNNSIFSLCGCSLLELSYICLITISPEIFSENFSFFKRGSNSIFNGSDLPTYSWYSSLFIENGGLQTNTKFAGNYDLQVKSIVLL